MTFQEILTVEKMCRKLKPVFGKKIDQLYLQYSLTDSREKRAEIQQALSVLYEKHLNMTLLDEKVLLSPPENNSVDGEYKLARITYADKDVSMFGLREKDWIRHVLISGMSGSGKTMLAFGILKEMIDKNKPFIVFDWKKSFRPLLLLDKNMLCFTIGNNRVANLFMTNINRPPAGIEPKEWINIICDLITESFFASYGVHKIIREALDNAFQSFGVYNGSNNYPTWKHIKSILEKKDIKHGREAEWLESALRIAHSMTFGSFGDAINSNDIMGMTVEELMDKRVIFELQILNSSEKKFFCEYILSYVFFTKKANEQKRQEFKGLILVDEAHNIFLKDKPTFVSESTTDMVYREMREYGFGLVCVDQHISKLSETVAGNSATNIAFQQMLPQDVDTVSKLMQMYNERKFFTMLPVGQAIVKLAERHYSPFLIKAPFIDLKEENVDDKLIKERMASLVKTAKRIKVFHEDVKEENLLKAIKKKYKVDVIKESVNTINHIQIYLVGEIKKFMSSGIEVSKIREHFLKEGYKRIDIDRALRNVAEMPENIQEIESFLNSNKSAKSFLKTILQRGIPTTQVYQKIGVSARIGNELKKQLLYLGLIEEVVEKNEKGWKKMIQLTDKGAISLKSHS
jgi:hypothetical protein